MDARPSTSLIVFATMEAKLDEPRKTELGRSLTCRRPVYGPRYYLGPA